MPKVEKNQTNLQKCSCPGCPTYNECGKQRGEKLFCAIGKGACEYQKNGCLCGACPVHMEHGLKNGYYCVQGSADEIG